MDFRTQIEQNKRDLELEIKRKNECLVACVALAAEDVRLRLLEVAKRIEKGHTLDYCGYLHPSALDIKFCKCKEKDASTFFKSQTSLTYDLTNEFNMFFQLLNFELKKDGIVLGKPFGDDWYNWYNDGYSVGTSHYHKSFSFDTNIVDKFNDGHRYKKVAIGAHYEFPYSCMWDKKSSKPKIDNIVIPFYYKF